MTKQTLIFSLLFISTLSYAGGGTETGSGGWVIVKDSEIVLADPFIKYPDVSGIGERWVLSDKLKAYLEHISNLMGYYGVPLRWWNPVFVKFFSQSTVRKKEEQWRYSEFWTKKVFSEEVQFRYTEDLPCHDPIEFIKDVEGEPMLLGCTNDQITWFKKSFFEKLTLKQQALAIMHERLHAFTHRGHDVICDFISILNTILTLQEKQSAGVLVKPSEKELEAMYRLKTRAEEMGFEIEASPILIWPNGGGVIMTSLQEPMVDKSSYISVGSMIYGYVYNPFKNEGWDLPISIGKNVTILNSILNTPTIEQGAWIENVFRNENEIFVGAFSILQNVTFRRVDHVNVGNSTQIFNFKFTTEDGWPTLYVGNNVLLSNADIESTKNVLDAWCILIVPVFYRTIRDNGEVRLIISDGTQIDLSERGPFKIHVRGGRTVVESKKDLMGLKRE